MRTRSSPRRLWRLAAPPPLWAIAPACLCLLTLAAFIASPIIAQAQATDTPAAPPQDLRQTALAYRQKQDFDKAIECYTTLLAQNPTDALSIKADLAICYKAKRDYAKATPLFEEVARSAEGTRLFEASFWVLDCLTEQEKNEEAIVYLDKMLADHPDWKYLIDYRRACCLCELQRHQEAVELLKQYLAETPDKDFARNVEVMIANITLAAFGKPDEARVLLEKVIADHPDYPGMIEVRSLVANCAYDKQNYAEAAELYKAAFECPEYGTFRPFIQYMIGDCYAQIEDYTKAFPAWDKLKDLFPSDCWVEVAAEKTARIRARTEGK